MTKKKNSDTDDDFDREDFAELRTLTRKQVLDMLRRGETLEDADLRGLDLSGVTFDGANLTNAKLGESNLQRASFRGTTLVGASFWNANLREASLDGANLEEADFDYCNLDGVSFKDAKVKRAIFPVKRLPIEQVQRSVRTGERVRMEPIRHEDED
ncbi:MAG: pentapeptide repeat-containing protein [Deltaproteobacteria bacterium]|nr:pentapeptide repeat-containing protein [Deltaproteobacteria bacterium]